MSNYFANLPAARIPRNALLDFSPINNAIDSNRQNALATRQLDMRQEEQTYQRGRDAKQDARVAVQDSRADEQYFANAAKAFAERPENDPVRANWPRLLKAKHPNLAALGPDYLDPIKGPALVMAEAGQYLDPRDSRAKDLALRKTEAEIGKINRDTSSAGEYGLQPILGTDANGNTVVMQAGKNGQLIRSQTPAGVTVDFGLRSAQSARGKEEGEVRGKAQANLPTVERNANKLISNIDAILKDPYLSEMTGPIQGRLPNVTAPANRVQSRIDQVQGQTFLQAFNDLRGGGAITEAEGAKATQSYNRLSTVQQGTQDYINALNEFKQDVIELADIARRKAAGGQQKPSPSGGPPAANDGWSIQRID